MYAGVFKNLISIKTLLFDKFETFPTSLTIKNAFSQYSDNYRVFCPQATRKSDLDDFTPATVSYDA